MRRRISLVSRFRTHRLLLPDGKACHSLNDVFSLQNTTPCESEAHSSPFGITVRGFGFWNQPEEAPCSSCSCPWTPIGPRDPSRPSRPLQRPSEEETEDTTVPQHNN
jgi:hypothetical protein